MNAAEERLGYRGRLAPSPTGYLHGGHARTFWVAQQRAREPGGTLILRNEDLDPDRSRPEFADAMMEDLRWFGFVDGRQGPQAFVAGQDFVDFVVWRHDGVPSYQLAVVVDDAAMRITEVVRGVDLLVSTARQLLLYRALGLMPPAFFHCQLVTDAAGVRLAKRHEALSLRRLREQGADPEQVRQSWKPSSGGEVE